MSSFMKRALKRYGTQFLDYFSSRITIPKIDHDAWIYALRAACAGCLALYISFSLDLHGSNWALTTCFIVGSERQSGRILAKSAARIVGTLVGVMASFTLVNAFAQERVLFICCFAAWLSICAYSPITSAGTGPMPGFCLDTPPPSSGFLRHWRRAKPSM